MRIAAILTLFLLAACASEPPPRPSGPEPLPATPSVPVERQSLAPPPGISQAPAPNAEPPGPLPLGPVTPGAASPPASPQVAAVPPGLARVAGAWEGRLRGDRGSEDWRLVLREDGAYRSTTLTASGAVEQHWGRYSFADNQLRLMPEGAEPRGRVSPGQTIVIPVTELAGSRMTLDNGTLTRAD